MKRFINLLLKIIFSIVLFGEEHIKSRSKDGVTMLVNHTFLNGYEKAEGEIPKEYDNIMKSSLVDGFIKTIKVIREIRSKGKIYVRISPTITPYDTKEMVIRCRILTEV
jgi:hypothetical protein